MAMKATKNPAMIRLGLLTIIDKHPGLDAIALKGKGWHPRTHGSLRDAESVGLLTYRNGGWYLNEGAIERMKLGYAVGEVQS